jgi:paraquat-inducible protein B
VNTLKSGFRGGKTVRRLDEFPELEKALRDGDLLTGRLCCAQLFDIDAGESSRVREQAIGKSLIPPLAG